MANENISLLAVSNGGDTRAIEGIDSVIFYRALKDRKTSKGLRIAFQTENELSEKSKTDSEITKDGALLKSKGLDSELSCTSYVAQNSNQYKDLTEDVRNQELIEAWIVYFNQPEDVDWNAQYFRGIISEKKDKAPAEGYIETEITITIQGKGKFGKIDSLPTSTTSTDYEFENLDIVVDRSREKK